MAKKNKKGAQEVVSKPPDLEEEARKKVDAFCPESFYWGTPSNKNAQRNMNSGDLFPLRGQQLLP